jgi:putative transposase
MARPHRLPFTAVCGAQRYSVTICAYQRRRYFADTRTVEWALSVFLEVAARKRFLILAYCFMPDHVHLLIEGSDESADLRGFVRAAKQSTGYQFTQRSSQRLWQENYFDRTLRREDTVVTVTKYLLNNPLRAGLVESLKDYPHWGSGVCSREDLLESISRS